MCRRQSPDGGSAKSIKMREIIRFAWGQASLGDFILTMSEKGLAALEFGASPSRMEDALRDRFREADLRGDQRRYVSSTQTFSFKLLPAVEARFLFVRSRRYLAGFCRTLDITQRPWMSECVGRPSFALEERAKGSAMRSKESSKGETGFRLIN